MRRGFFRFIGCTFMCIAVAVFIAGFIGLVVGGGDSPFARVCFEAMFLLTIGLMVKGQLIYEYRDLVKEIKEKEERRAKEIEEQKRKEYEARHPFKVPRGECFVFGAFRWYYDCEGRYCRHEVTFTEIKEFDYTYYNYEAYLERSLDSIGNCLYDHKDNNSIRSFVPLIQKCLSTIEHNIREIDLHEKNAKKFGCMPHYIDWYSLREQNTQMVKTILKYDAEMQNIIKTTIVEPEIADQCKTTN